MKAAAEKAANGKVAAQKEAAAAAGERDDGQCEPPARTTLQAKEPKVANSEIDGQTSAQAAENLSVPRIDME